VVAVLVVVVIEVAVAGIESIGVGLVRGVEVVGLRIVGGGGAEQEQV
jgi:hypothetical protein